MAATVSIYADIGGTDNTPASENDVDALGPPNLKFKDADDLTIDNVAKVVIPSGADVYSYWKSIYLYCDAVPDNQIDTVELYSDGTFGDTGVDYRIGTEQPVKTNALDTGYDVADSSLVVTTHTDITAEASLSALTSGAPKSITIGEAPRGSGA